MLARALAIAALAVGLLVIDAPSASAQKGAKASKAAKHGKASPREKTYNSRKNRQLIRSKGKGSRSIARDRKGRPANRLGSSRGGRVSQRSAARSRRSSTRATRPSQRSAFKRGPSLQSRPGQSGVFKSSVMRLRRGQ